MRMMQNAMRLQAMRASAERMETRVGNIVGYDPGNYAVKVQIQPEGAITGWIPLVSPWIGNGWGLFAPPTLGDLTTVNFIGGEIEAGYAEGRFFNDADRPLSVPSGEFWVVHKSGSVLKFHNDGSVEVIAAGNLTATVGGNMTVSVTGNLSETAPNITLNGNVTINGQLTQGKGSNGGSASLQGPLNVVDDVVAGTISLDHHTHPDAQGGNTGQPQ